MKIVCPTCEANYEVPESVLAAKRQVRCARCGNDWIPGANWQPEGASAEVEVAPAPSVAPATPAQPPPPPAPPPAPPPVTTSIEPPPAVAPAPPAAAAPAPEPPPLEQVHETVAAIDEPAVAPPAEPVGEELPPAAARLRQSAATAFGDPIETVSAPQPASKGTPVGAWILSILVLIAFAGAAVVFKLPIMKAWPPSERVYDAVGLNPPAR